MGRRMPVGCHDGSAVFERRPLVRDRGTDEINRAREVAGICANGLLARYKFRQDFQSPTNAFYKW